MSHVQGDNVVQDQTLLKVSWPQRFGRTKAEQDTESIKNVAASIEMTSLAFYDVMGVVCRSIDFDHKGTGA